MTNPEGLLPCMGGWCELREHCANYHAGRDGCHAQDRRICEPGKDGLSTWAVVIPLQSIADVAVGPTEQAR